MTREEKTLRLIDLAGRLPYGVKCQFAWTYNDETTNGEDVIEREDDTLREIDMHTNDVRCDYYDEWVDVSDCIPYLRPMLSMTEEELKNYRSKQTIIFDFKNNKLYVDNCYSLDYLNSIYVDYRGLIEKGLALKAPVDMYKNKD